MIVELLCSVSMNIGEATAYICANNNTCMPLSFVGVLTALGRSDDSSSVRMSSSWI